MEVEKYSEKLPINIETRKPIKYNVKSSVKYIGTRDTIHIVTMEGKNTKRRQINTGLKKSSILENYTRLDKIRIGSQEVIIYES